MNASGVMTQKINDRSGKMKIEDYTGWLTSEDPEQLRKEKYFKTDLIHLDRFYYTGVQLQLDVNLDEILVIELIITMSQSRFDFIARFYVFLGLNQLLWYYADLESKKCYHDNSDVADFEKEEKACSTWRRFAKLVHFSLIMTTVVKIFCLRYVIKNDVVK